MTDLLLYLASALLAALIAVATGDEDRRPVFETTPAIGAPDAR